MQSDEVRQYMEAANQAIEDAESEREANNTEGNVINIDMDEVPFITVARSNKRKGSPQEKEQKNRLENTPEGWKTAISLIHSNMGLGISEDELDPEEAEVTIN